MQRREFLQSGSAVAMAAWAGLQLVGQKTQAQEFAAVLPEDVPADNYHAPDWLRYSRTVYFDGYSPPIYPHMKDFDARRLVDAVVEMGGNALRFQPMGYWASYPSKVFPVHEELGGRDLIGEVGKECRRAGIHQFCYLPYGAPGMLSPEYVKEHPKYAGWVLRDPQGRQYGTYANIGWGPLYRYCTTGDVYRTAMRDAVREYCERDLEGVYFDAPSGFGYTGVCFCDSCRTNFKKFSGMDLDRLASLATANGLPFDWNGNFPRDVDTEAFRAWYAWVNQLTKEDLLDFRKIIHAAGKYMLCHNAQSWTGTSLFMQYLVPDGFMVESSREIYDRLTTGMMGASMARPYKKMAQMYLGSYAVTWFNEPPYERPWVTHNTNMEDSDEIRMEGFTNLACGNVPLYATANRQYFKTGSGSISPVRDVFDFMKRAETVLKDSVPVPYVTMLPTWESQQRWREKEKSWNWSTMSGGMGLALLDQRISFDVNPSTEMTEGWLRQQKIIALNGATGISEQDAKKLSAWVKAGGGLLATYDTGLYDEKGQLRSDGGALQEVLGVKMKGVPLASQPECYYRVKEGHAALGEYHAGAIVEGDGSLVPVEATGGAKVIADCWNLGTGEVRGPAIIVNSYGRGRTIYVSGSLESNYLFDRVESNSRLLRSMVEYLGGGASQPFKLQAPRGVYGVLRKTTNDDLVLWLLANVGHKDAAVGRMRQQFVPVANVEVSIRVPQGKQVKGARLMRADRSISYTIEANYARVTIPSLHIAEVVHLELA